MFGSPSQTLTSAKPLIQSPQERQRWVLFSLSFLRICQNSTSHFSSFRSVAWNFPGYPPSRYFTFTIRVGSLPRISVIIAHVPDGRVFDEHAVSTMSTIRFFAQRPI